MKDELKKDEIIDESEEVSLDDMMALPEEKTESDSATDANNDATSDVATDESAENEAESEETETASDMIDEAAADAVDEATPVKEEKLEKVEESTDETTPASSTPKPAVYKGKWYIVHTYSGHENKVARTLMQRVQAMGFEERIYDALVPTRDTIRVRGGKKETIKEKIFPGYILVNMDLSDEAWVLVRTTPGVTSFVGAQNKPTPIRDDEVQAIVAFVGQKDPVYKAQFSTGEAVKITDGPFSDFLGTVESIDEAKGKIKVLVSIFGRETPVELDFLQVAKI